MADINDSKELVREFVSTVFVVDKNKVLMTWNKKVNNWIPIGGHIEINELPSQSAIREAKEESGLDIELINPMIKSQCDNLIQPANMHLDIIKENHHHMNLLYFGIVKGGECFKIDDEGKELRWFSMEELEKENLLPNIKEWAKKALEKLSE